MSDLLKELRAELDLCKQNFNEVSRICEKHLDTIDTLHAEAANLSAELGKTNKLAQYDETAARIEELEAKNAKLRETLGQAEEAISEFYRYWTGGETRGSYDGRPEREGLWKAMAASRRALKTEEAQPAAASTEDNHESL